MPYSNPCDSAKNEYQGDGTTVLFSVTFEYAEQSDVKVYLWNDNQYELTTDWTWANATQIQFNTAPAVPSNPSTINNVRIVRETSIEPLSAQFYPGASIKAKDLNDNFEQLKFAVEENRCIADSDYWKKYEGTIHSNETWSSSDDLIATTKAINDNIVSQIDTAITTDITGTDGIDVRPNVSNGTTVIGIQEGGIDANRLLEDDIIIESEGLTDSQNAAFNDNRLVSAATAEHRYRNYVQTSDPGINNKLKGQIWLENDANKTLSVFDGSSWVGVASGGTFTTQPTTIYVDRYSGNDLNNGRRIINQVRTIKRALELANDGDLISIAPGVYQEQLPLDITQKNLSIVGDSIRSVFVQPQVDYESSMQDPYQTMEAAQTNGGSVTNPDYQSEVDAVMFRVNSGTYIANMTFVGMKADQTGTHPIDPYNASTNPTGIPGKQGWIIGFLPGAKINKSPYIQNCTNFTDSGIDNSVEYDATPVDENNAPGYAGDLTSAFTGGGIIIDGAKPAFTSKLRSMVADSFTQVGLKGPGIFVTNNGYTQLTSSYSFFGHYHLKAHNGGQANLAASTTDFGDYALVADGKSPSAVFTAYTANPYSSGATTIQLTNIGNFNIGGQGSGVPSSNMVVQIGSVVYPITNWDPVASEITIFRANQTNASLNDGLQSFVSNNTTVSFYFRSMVASSGHTMEYAGSGTDYRALPENGGTPDDTKQLTELNNGKVWAVIVDHQGKFKAGDFEIDQQSGTVHLPTGGLGVPLLIETLDTADEIIQSSDQNGIQIGSKVDLNNNKIVELAAPTQNTDAANKQYTDGKVEAVAVTSPITESTATVNGVKTVTLDINDASTTSVGVVQLNNATNSTSITTAATANAVKTAYDLADAALPVSGGTMSGNIDLDGNNLQDVGSLGVDNVQVNNNLEVNGTFTVTGTFTQVNSQSLVVADKNIEIATVTPIFIPISGTVSGTTITVDDTSNLYVGQALTKQSGSGDIGTGAYISNVNSSTVISFGYASGTPVNGAITFTVGGATDFTADGAGITVNGTTNKTFNWVDNTDSWTSSENIDLASGKDYKINNVSVLSSTALGSSVVGSNLTSVGTIGTGVWNGTEIGTAYGGTGQTSYADGELLIGNTTGNTLSKATLTAGTNVSITNGNGSITIAATDTDTTYTAGDGLDLTNTEFSVDLAANGGLEISNTELQVDSTVARTTGDTFTGDLFLSKTSGNVLNTLGFKELNGSSYVGFKAPSAIAVDVTWTLPDADGDPAQILSTDGNGILYWQTPTAAVLKGGGTNRVFFENDQAVTADYSITLGKNAMSAGPLTVNPNITVTIPSGSTWTIV